MVSVPVSKFGKTDLVFVQPGAKTNSVYYCENVLEQGLLLAICRISNNDFVFKQDGAPCMPFTTLSLSLYLHSNVPEFTEPEKMASEQFGSKSRGLLSVDNVVADGVSPHSFRH